ncbi:putative phosphomutase [Rhodotorula paludigena]|uniref:putative phosphomutase n=1 Tax=Rhodotorula paludigena TaxID=86838 RepID=UPI00317D20FE
MHLPDDLDGGARTALSGERQARLFTPTNYTSVEGYFVQSSPSFNSTDFDPLTSSFGLIDRTPRRWSSFRERVAQLNAQADEHTVYKVFYLARHGEGWHNVGEREHGTEAWNSYWSMLNGDGNITWGPDPLLTPTGVAQARRNTDAWAIEAAAGAPLPQRLYSSPLSRAMSTLDITWHDLLLKEGKAIPLVRENLREVLGVHTCDKRETKSNISKRYPAFAFEVPFSEHDQRWSPDWRESDQQAAFRMQQVLNHIFAAEAATFISITAHGGAIKALLRACGHPNPDLHVGTGSMVPVVVKAVDNPRETNELLAGGQSIPAPVPTNPSYAPQARRTRDL